MLSEREQDILTRAEEVRKRRTALKSLPVYPEPKRTKVHWDYVLSEMEWMAKEFQK